MERAQQLGALAIPPEDLALILSTNKGSYKHLNSSSRGFWFLSACDAQTYTGRQSTQIRKIKVNECLKIHFYLSLKLWI